MHKAVFFDRDGVINKLVKREDGSLTSPWKYNEFEYMPNVKKVIRLIKYLGYKTYIVTNQPGIYDKKMSKYDLTNISYNVKKQLGVDRILSALDRTSDWYKPRNGMLECIIHDDNIDRAKSYIIGDRWKDIVPGIDSGLITVFFGEKYYVPDSYKDYQPDFKINDVMDLYKLIRGNRT
jgi:D-glycero-D-manno-heptose 1,7-bisphosphate phosphatase